MSSENRKYRRFLTTLPVRFNLNPDHHVVPAIRKMGVGGTVRNISTEGLLIDSRLDLLDICQIFPEAMDDNSDFQLELQLTDSRERRLLIRGVVKWYHLSEPDSKIRHFQAGLYLKDPESRAIAQSLVESITAEALN
jgi:hypothetical protein